VLHRGGYFALRYDWKKAAQPHRGYEPHWVPGLLQTEEYAPRQRQEAYDAPDSEVERRVTLASPAEDHGRPDPPRLGRLDDGRCCAVPWTRLRQAIARQVDRLIEATEREVTLSRCEVRRRDAPGAFGLFYCWLPRQGDARPGVPD